MRAVFVPGAVGGGGTHTLPDEFPNMRIINSAEIWRASGVATTDEHAAAELQAAIPVDDHTQAEIVAAVLDHPVHPHNLTTVGAAGGGTAVTEPVVPGPLEAAGGGQVNPAAVDDLAAAQGHADGAAPVAHVYGAGVPAVHAMTLTATILVAATPTLVTNRTFTDTSPTLVGDMYSLDYEEEGRRSAQ